MSCSSFPEWVKMAEGVLALTKDNWETEVVSSTVPVLVDFWAPWCGPCRALGPTIDKLAAKYHGKVKVAKLNTDSAPEIAVQFSISGIPAVLVFNGGKEVNRLVGVQPQSAYERVLDGLAGVS